MEEVSIICSLYTTVDKYIHKTTPDRELAQPKQNSYYPEVLRPRKVEVLGVGSYFEFSLIRRGSEQQQMFCSVAYVHAPTAPNHSKDALASIVSTTRDDDLLYCSSMSTAIKSITRSRGYCPPRKGYDNRHPPARHGVVQCNCREECSTSPSQTSPSQILSIYPHGATRRHEA